MGIHFGSFNCSIWYLIILVTHITTTKIDLNIILQYKIVIQLSISDVLLQIVL
jgi:hypothetical protein